MALPNYDIEVPLISGCKGLTNGGYREKDNSSWMIWKKGILQCERAMDDKSEQERFPRNQECKGRKNNTRTIAVENPTQNYQAEEEQPTNHALMAFTSSGSSSSSDSEVDSCSKTCVKAYATLKEQYDNLSSDYKKSQFNLVSYKAVRLRDNALNEYKMNLEKAETERDQLKQTLEKFQNSSKSLNNILKSQVINKFKTGLVYDVATAASPAVESFVNLTDKSGSDKGYHSVPPPLTGNFIPCKPDLTFVDEIVESENLDVLTLLGNFRTGGVAVNTVRPVNTANTKVVNTVRPVNTANTKAFNNGNQQQKEYKEKGVIESGYSRHMTGIKCYLDEYKDYDGGFVSFGDGKERIFGLKGNVQCGLGLPSARKWDHLGKFEGKADEGYFIGYSVVSKAMRVFNKRTRIVEEILNIRFLENTPNVKGNGPDWLFDVDSLSISMNYVLDAAGNKTNGIEGTKDNIVAGPKDCEGDAGMKPTKVDEYEASDKSGKHDQEARSESERINQREICQTDSLTVLMVLILFSPFKNAFTLPPVQIYLQWIILASLEMLMMILGVEERETSRAIGTKWVFRNKKDERGIVVKNKARLVAQGHTQEEGIDYDEVFAPVVRIEAIRLFLAYASFKDFIVYQMDVKSAFLYGKIEEEVYVCQPPSFEDPHFPDKVYKVEKALYGLH
ncbi:putative ribonuclease H-like domain-containing protein [Tanacetum coccineum]